MSVRAALVTVGDELLLGQTIDSNAAWLGRQLADLGIPVVRGHTVADSRNEIQEAVRASTAVADVVLVSGGLGPTPDDLTREAVAGLLDRPLELDETLLVALEARFEARGLDRLPANNRSQAQVPQGARVLRNPHGTAPGLAMEAGDTLVVLLPGVPRELKGIFEGELGELLTERFGDRASPVRMTVIHTTGIPESLLAERVADVLPPDLGAMALAFLPGLRGVDLRLTLQEKNESAAEAEFDRVAQGLQPVVGPYRFESEEGDITASVLEALAEHGATLATAESCTGGLIGKRITDRAGSSSAYLGGVVAYANDVKTRQLGVEPDLIEAHGAVSEVVARRMAEGVARTFGADAAISVTGVAGPGGGSPDKPVGTVWHAASYQGRTVAELHTFQGNRDAVRERAAQAALFLLLRLLDGRV